MTGKNQKAAKKGAPNFLIDFAPLLIFFATNFIYGRYIAEDATQGIFAATISLMITMPIAMAFSWHKRKHIPPMLWMSGLLVLFFGGLTIYFNDERFIKVKPTIIFTLFSVILWVGLMKGKPFLKFLLEAAFPPMSHKGWIILTRNWALFFLFKAGLNEYVWRNFSTDTWVTFKTFGFIGLTFIFIFTQVPILMKYGDLKNLK